MRKDSLLTLTALALVLTLGGCSKDDDAGTDNDGIIRFGVSEFPESRAAINSAANFKTGDAFDVWGYYTSPTAGKIDVFKGENGSGIPVAKSNTGWGYAGGDRYWVKEMPYTFYAVYPSELGKLSEDGNTITIDNFNCSATGDDAIDLMTANTNISYSTEQSPQPVALQFSHELARLSFVVQSEGSRVQIEQISIVGVGYKGTFTSPNSWTVTELSTESSPFSRTMFKINPDETRVDVFGDILLLPATAKQLENAKLKLTYRYEYNGTTGEPLSKEIPLVTETSKVKSWDKGQSYNYKLSIPVQSEDLKLNVTVLPWNKNEDASVEW